MRQFQRSCLGHLGSDFAVAGIMAALALSGAYQILRHALAELRYSLVAQG